MFNLTQEEVKNTINSYQKIIDRVNEVVEEIGFLDNEYDYLNDEKTEFDIEGETILVTAEDSTYDLYDATSTSFPISYLFEPEEMHKNIYRINRRKMEEASRKKEEEKKRMAELEELERLKKKYE